MPSELTLDSMEGVSIWTALELLHLLKAIAEQLKQTSAYGYAEFEVNANTLEEAIGKAMRKRAKRSIARSLFLFNFREGEVKGDVFLHAAKDGEKREECHVIPEWDGMPRYEARPA